MNARQMKKCLKKRINRLESDNDLMRRIIADRPKMQELYYLFNKPVNVRNTTMEFQEYKVKRSVPAYIISNGNIGFVKRELEKDLLDVVKYYITYETDSYCGMQTITASMYVGIR